VKGLQVLSFMSQGASNDICKWWFKNSKVASTSEQQQQLQQEQQQEQGEQERQEESLERGESYSSNNTDFRGAKEN
jgi:hypothetical protein